MPNPPIHRAVHPLPTEIIEHIICSIVQERNDLAFDEDREPAGRVGSPERAALCACLQVSSEFYYLAHRILFSKIAFVGDHDDPSYITRRADLLAALISDSERMESTTRIWSISRMVKVLVVSGIHTVSEALHISKVLDPIAHANEGPTGGRLVTLDISAPSFFYPSQSSDSTDYPTVAGPFWCGSLKLASSKSIRNLTLSRFPSIPVCTFAGFTFERLSLIECGFDFERWRREIPWDASGGTALELQGGPPVISTLHWQNHVRHLGGADKMALFAGSSGSGRSNVQTVSFTIVPSSILPGRRIEVVPESVLSTRLPFDKIVIYIQDEWSRRDGPMVPTDIRLKPLSSDSLIHFHKTPNVTLSVSCIESTGGVYVMISALCALLRKLARLEANADGEAQYHNYGSAQQLTSSIKCLTLVISPVIFWPRPRKYGVALVIGEEGLSRGEYGAFEKAWRKVDSILSAPVYQDVGKVVFEMEGDLTGYNAAMAFDKTRALSAPRNVLWKFLPILMSVRANERSISFVMDGNEMDIS